MSENCDLFAIEYRAFIASFAKELTSEEVYEVAYVWLRNRGDVDLYSPSRKTKACGIELFAKLECSGVFSCKDVSGLSNIAKKLNRTDLVDKVERFSKDMKKKTRANDATGIKRKDSQERQELEKTFSTMVVQMTVLEGHISLLQKMLSEKKTDVELRDEGMEIVEHSGDIAHKLVLNLDQVQKRLARRSRTSSSASGSSDDSSRRGSRELSPAPSPCEGSIEGAVSTSPNLESRRKGVKPTPKKRTLIGQPCPQPIQESTGDSSKFKQPSVPSHIHGKPSPTPRKKNGNTVSLSVPVSLSTVPNTSAEVRLEEDEGTGDSGMETGSGGAYYSPLLWRYSPPPEKRKVAPVYMALREETRDEDLPYEEMNYKEN